MKLTTAGESHGKALVAIIEGLPAHLSVDKQAIDEALRLRQGGFGRGDRQRIEKDEVEILSGVRNGETLGSPLTLCIYNKDFINWQDVMRSDVCDEDAMAKKSVTAVRPGHADLTGMMKFLQNDARNVLERASARETAVRVAAGEIFRQYLAVLGVEIAGYVKAVCDVKDGTMYAFNEILQAKNTLVGMLNPEKEKQAIEKILQLKKEGNTAGGVIEIRVKGLKSGFGSFMTYSEKLDARLSQGLMSIQAAKGVEIGDGFSQAFCTGKEAHDEIFCNEQGVYRNTNHAGGIEGGMSNGEEIVVRVAMKPIPTLMQGLRSIDYCSKQATVAAAERSDVCAIFAFERIAEAVVAEVIANAVSQRLGGDTMQQVKERYQWLP